MCLIELNSLHYIPEINSYDFYECPEKSTTSGTSVIASDSKNLALPHPNAHVVTTSIFTHSKTLMTKVYILQWYTYIPKTLRIFCANNLGAMFVLTYISKLLFESFDTRI